MISETARYYGSFFALFLERAECAVSIQRLAEVGMGCYLIDGRVPIYLKHSTRRRGPWAFNFFRTHQQAQQELYGKYGECITCMICGKDGIAGLRMEEFRQVLDTNFEDQEVVTVRRRLRKMYHITGRDGSLDRRLSRNAVFDNIINACEIGRPNDPYSSVPR